MLNCFVVMTIPNLAPKGNKGLILAIVIILLASSASFFGGMLVEKDQLLAGQGGGISIGAIPLQNGLPAAVLEAQKQISSTAINQGGEVVASKAGTNYYLPWCKGALKLKPENQLWFASAQEAENKGYTPAKGCPGI
jgi:hypothetical protein